MERRSAERYPIVLNAHYQALRKRSGDGAVGRTVNISSGGLLIVSDHKVPVGVRLEVLVEWPALLDGAIELLLVATGKVVRVRESSFALELSRYEFRTTKRKLRSAADVVYSAATATGAS
jgi:c-di-GMP-binding flagellar brake protein YcgR